MRVAEEMGAELAATVASSRWCLATAVVARAVLGAGCASRYYFAPTENVSASLAGRPAARYSVPPENPRGRVYVASFGIVDADVTGNGQKTPLLQVRMDVSNDSGAGAWTVDTRQQLLEIAGAGQSRPALVNSAQSDAPTVTIPTAQKRVIDLYYELPPTMSTAAEIPSFDLLWHVVTPQRVVAERTPFQKQEVQPPPDADVYADFALGPGWGPFWWYDPFYPGLTFYPPPVVLHRRYPGLIGHPPHPRFTAHAGWPHAHLRGAPPPRGGRARR